MGVAGLMVDTIQQDKHHKTADRSFVDGKKQCDDIAKR
jgi:hypothetical protein